jgi:formylglycine-generating enzyme required for sulfatase activity
MPTSSIVLQDRYQIESQLGKGGMGTVYQATDLKFGSTVAIKEMMLSGDDLVRAFEREARLLNKLRHGALPVVMDYFTEDDKRFLVMQYIPGDDLANLLTRRGEAFPPDTVLDWADRLLDVLTYLHGHETPIIHRDIKPQNLKLTPRGEVILLDFGLSKSAHFGATVSSTSVSVMGYTPYYAPFEQINGIGTDVRSDLFSLAATVYHLITGALPPDAMTRAQSVMNGQPDPLRPADELNPNVTRAVASVLQDALAMNREQRPVSAPVMREALHAARGALSHEGSTTAGDGYAQTVTSSGASNNHASILSQPSSHTTPDASHPSYPGATASAAPASDAPPRKLWTWPQLSLMFGAALIVSFCAALWWGWSRPAAERATPAAGALGAPQQTRIKTAPPEATFKFETIKLSASGAVSERQAMQGRFYEEDLGDAQAIELVSIPAGTFSMGVPDTLAGDYPDETPQHEVSIKQFYLSKYEVTQREWRAVATSLPKVSRDLNPSPSEVQGDSLPVTDVSWEDVMEFCARLSVKTGRLYRLPSEAEWEYAARGGTTSAFFLGATITPEYVNYDGTGPYGDGPQGVYRQKPVPVGSLKVANPFGLYDVHGNVWEWCAGEYHDSYRSAPSDGSAWVTGGDVTRRVVRGGSWNNLAVDCRSANRYSFAQRGKHKDIGFRLAMAVG